MRILYAVQATGNGHITRARVMAKAFAKLSIEVDWVFSGRDADAFFDMEEFGNYQTYRGLTFITNSGKIQYLKTALNNNLMQFIRDVSTVDFTRYDLLINDFEPVTAWAAKLRNFPSIGLSHQMAFQHNVPTAESNLLARSILKYFAPVSTPIGLHWDSFASHLLPPIVEKPQATHQLSLNKILVYCPFDNLQEVVDWLTPFNNHQFHIFHADKVPVYKDHIHLHEFSREQFLAIQAKCSGVITSGGFELPSEALQLGQKLLIKPLKGQMEQASNALALAMIDRATVIQYFSHRKLKTWLDKQPLPPIHYPDVAYEVAKWIVSSEKESVEDLSRKLWHSTIYNTPETSGRLCRTF